MNTYLNLNNEPVFVKKIKTNGDEIKNLKNQTENHDHENILKSLKTDDEFYKKQFKI